MKAYVITIEGHEYSETCAQRCIDSAQGIEVERFHAVTPDVALDFLNFYNLKWTWKDSGECAITKLKFHRYGGGLARIACALSHYLLWVDCSEPILILEHDAVFIRPWEPFDFRYICQINDPCGATPMGGMWSDAMAGRGPGVFMKTPMFYTGRPDGLAGHSAYCIKPEAAQFMVDLAGRVGLWPNDALMCRQLVPDLEELYPFLTRVEQSQSTTCV